MSDDPTPVRKISTTALDLAAIASTDLMDHLRRAGFVRRLGPDLFEITDPPPGFIARVASWFARAGRRVAEVERKENDRFRAERDLAIQQRDLAIQQRDTLSTALREVELERNQLASNMRIKP